MNMIEIERKYLVDTNMWSPSEVGVDIQQGYLSLDIDRTVRVRIYGEDAFITVKGITTGIAREEYEYPIPLEDAKRMLATLCLPGVIRKTRYVEIYYDKTWEIDVFDGDNKGLVVAEIELDSSAEEFELPPFLGDEVSDDPRYFNSSLIKSPFIKWSAS